MLFSLAVVVCVCILSTHVLLVNAITRNKRNPLAAKLKSVDDYYANIDKTATNDVLKGQLFALINPHVVFDYDTAFVAFEEVDTTLPGYPCNPNNLTYIPDIYSTVCWRDQQGYTPGGQCGNYKKEGDCYNREHIWPKSWFGGFDYGMNAQTDLFELWPSDGYVNGLRGNLPLGDVVAPISYTSSNGCRIGVCAAGSSYGSCFEVTDKLKGDIARSYFYLATAYWKQWSCCDEPAVNGSDIKPWMEQILRTWHANDAVDQSEIDRNDIIYNNWQQNRNPFIDHPEWVAQIDNF
jgi:endonuclease I